jgi:subtilisin family serine protease
MAAPYVAGAAALYKSQFPNASPAQTMATTMASITSSIIRSNTLYDRGIDYTPQLVIM